MDYNLIHQFVIYLKTLIMNATIQSQTPDNAAITVGLFPISEIKHCSDCSIELPLQQNNRRTSFGLNLCDDCLYS